MLFCTSDHTTTQPCDLGNSVNIRNIMRSKYVNSESPQFGNIQSIKYRHREERILHGTLRVREQWLGDKLIASDFTLDSLAHVLGIPMSTMEGRYKRAFLSRWMVPIINGAGRPTRGFPYALLAPIMQAVQNPRSMILQDANGSSVGPIKPAAPQAELDPYYHGGEPYFTVSALSRSFGLSETTTRKKLRAAGLLALFEDLTQRGHGGRPTRGIPHRYLGHIKLAITQPERSQTPYDQAVAKADGSLEAAQREMEAIITPHTPPKAGSMQAWDSEAMAPVHRAPVNAVNSNDPAIDEMMADVEAILASHKKTTSAPVDTGETGASAHQIPHPIGQHNPFMD